MVSTRTTSGINMKLHKNLIFYVKNEILLYHELYCA